MPNLDDEDIKENEWTKHVIILPVDDYDEDDALDARIAEHEKRQKDRVVRGGFFGTQ